MHVRIGEIRNCLMMHIGEVNILVLIEFFYLVHLSERLFVEQTHLDHATYHAYV